VNAAAELSAWRQFGFSEEIAAGEIMHFICQAKAHFD